MRLLAFSDIHNNLTAVRKLRASQTNSFDAVVVAGDIGSQSADEFFRIVTTFNCPILYVYGNWDRELDYRKSYGGGCHLIHANVLQVGAFHFTGFSGCPSGWGKNPVAFKLLKQVNEANSAILEAWTEARRKLSRHARDRTFSQPGNPMAKIKSTKAYQKYITELSAAKSTILRQNRESVAQAVRRTSADPRKCVIVTHERFSQLGEHVPGSLLHLYGHVHRYSDQMYKGTRYVNVAVLDRPIPVRPRAKERWTLQDCLNVNGGNYAIIEIDSSQTVRAQCVYMRRDYQGWLPAEDSRLLGPDWIPQEKEWTPPSDMSVH